MNTSLTICDFLEQTGAQATFFDMGRRVIEIPLDTMRRFESAEIAYPQPFLRHAWLGILLQYPETGIKTGDSSSGKEQHNIWFIKLPLDERGLLLQAARDDFLQRVLETMADTQTDNEGKLSLDDNPHGFTPREDKMAIFHAKVSRLLMDPPSQFYAHAHDYFFGEPGFEQWNFVGLQGIADVAARLDVDNNEQILVDAITQLPAIPLSALCSCLEHTVPSAILSHEIARRVSEALEKADTTVITAGVRGLSNSQDTSTLQVTLHDVLSNPVGQHVEVLAAIAGRCWQALENPELRLLFLEALACCEAGQQAFNSILADLLFMPGLRQSLKADFDHPKRSEKLAEAINAFLSSVQTSSTA